MANFEMLDTEFINELAIATDVLFEPDHPTDPRPTLRALTNKPAITLSLHTTYWVAAALMHLVTPGSSDMSRLELAHELVNLALDGVWDVDQKVVITVQRAVFLLEDGAPPPLESGNFIPMVLFTLGLSATISSKYGIAPGDAIRRLVEVPPARHGA